MNIKPEPLQGFVYNDSHTVALHPSVVSAVNRIVNGEDVGDHPKQDGVFRLCDGSPVFEDGLYDYGWCIRKNFAGCQYQIRIRCVEPVADTSKPYILSDLINPLAEKNDLIEESMSTRLEGEHSFGTEGLDWWMPDIHRPEEFSLTVEKDDIPSTV